MPLIDPERAKALREAERIEADKRRCGAKRPPVDIVDATLGFLRTREAHEWPPRRAGEWSIVEPHFRC